MSQALEFLLTLNDRVLEQKTNTQSESGRSLN